ncbi:MAG TPA: type 4a pilus biogenesis protein PilO [Candidatus Acidoferrales bacterium]|nr:type 4a pilus biogenesis protein PilO [Candidatus Acidoferrales bacterium]
MSRWYAYRRWVYTALVVLLVLDAGVYFGWVQRPPMAPELARAQLAALEREVAERGAEVSRLQRVREQVPHLRPKLDAFTTECLPGEQAGFSQVAADLQEAANQAGISLEAVSYQTRVDEQQADLLRVEVSATLEGLYPSLLRYLEELEKSPHFYLISELAVVGARGSELRLELKLATYFRRGAA